MPGHDHFRRDQGKGVAQPTACMDSLSASPLVRIYNRTEYQQAGERRCTWFTLMTLRETQWVYISSLPEETVYSKGGVNPPQHLLQPGIQDGNIGLA
jgi:hypothetical protein